MMYNRTQLVQEKQRKRNNIAKRRDSGEEDRASWGKQEAQLLRALSLHSAEWEPIKQGKGTKEMTVVLGGGQVEKAENKQVCTLKAVKVLSWADWIHSLRGTCIWKHQGGRLDETRSKMGSITQPYKSSETVLLVTTWADLQGVTPSERSQTEREKYHMISLTCGI